MHDVEFRQEAMARARYEWVLFVEANERITPELTAEIRTLLSIPPAKCGYAIPREHFFLGHPLKHFSWAAARVMRLVRRDKAFWRSGRGEPRLVAVGSKVGRLKQTLLNYVALDLDRFLARQQREATWLALDAYDAGKRATWLKLGLRAPSLFVKHFLLGGGFLDGRPGLMAAALLAYGALLRDCKLWERQHSLASHDPPRWRMLRHVFSPPAMKEAGRDAV
jgi:hypothetical protein